MSQESASPVEIHFEGQIYNLSTFPSSFEDLIAKIKQHFTDTLPKPWSLQYEDYDGDRIMLVHNEDFEALTKELGNSFEHLKVYIIPKNSDCIILERQESGKKSPRMSNNQSMESYNVLEEDQADENKQKLDQTDSSEVISFDSPKSNNSSMIHEIIDRAIESPKRRIADLPTTIQDHIKEFLLPIKASMMEQSSQTDTKEKQDHSLLIESSSQTNEIAKELTEDKIVQTNNQALTNEDKGLQFDSEDFAEDKEAEEKIISLDNSTHSADRPNPELGYIMLRSHVSGEEDYLTNHELKAEDNLHETLKSSMGSNQYVPKEDLNIKNLVIETVSANLPQIALLVKDHLERCGSNNIQDSKKEKPAHSQCYCDGCGMCPNSRH